MILVKIHHTEYRDIIAICDSDLIGKKFEENGLQLEITERFYKGNFMEEEQILTLLKDAENVNIVGKESIKVAIEAGIVDKESIIKIQGIPHAQYTIID